VVRRNVRQYAPFPPFTGGQRENAEMPYETHPRKFWSQNANAGMSKMSRSKGRVQHPDAGYVNQMSILPEQFTGGQNANAAMPKMSRPRQFNGVMRQTQKCYSLFYPDGANDHTQKCHVRCAPDIFIWCQGKIAEMLLLLRTKGRAKIFLQKCHVTNALPNKLQGSL